MKTRIIWLAALALLAALVISGTAFAEGEVPLPSGAEEPPATTGDPTAVEEALPPDPVIPAEAAPEEVAEAVAEAPAVEEPAVPVVEEPIASVPAADVSLPAAEEVLVLVDEAVLVDAEGEPLVMASEESAEILAAADPFFISGGTTYSFYQAVGACAGAPNCFDGLSNPIQYAIDYIQLNATLPYDGRIYVEKATYTGAVTVDGSLANLNSLTGLIGLPTAGLFPTISSTLTLKNLTNGFSLMGFNVTGGITVQNSSGQFKFDTVSGNLTMDTVDASGSTGHGIHIKNHKGNIVLQGVTSSNNTSAGRGVWVENQLLGNVTINDSTFENNASHGIKLGAKGVITIDGVHTNSNNIGIVVDTCSALTIKNTEANNNRTAGIWAEPVGKMVTLENVTANNNGDNLLSPHGIRLIDVGIVNAKKIWTNSNYGDGLRISSFGTVTLTSITSIDNDDFGVVITSPVSAAVINGIVTNDNALRGLAIETKGATVRNAIALNNGIDGIYLNLSGGTGLLETVNADTNAGWGVYFETSLAAVVNVTMKNVGTRQNAGGIHIQTLGAVTLIGSGAFQSQDFVGVYIATRGAVTLTDFWSGYNAGSGLMIEGLYTYSGMGPISMASPTSVLINISPNKTNFNWIQGNGQADDEALGMHGAYIISERPVVITNFYANDNHGYGIYVTGPNLYNPILAHYVLSRSGPVTIASTVPAMRLNAQNNMIGIKVVSNSTVTLAKGEFNNNAEDGLYVRSLGAISLSGISAYQNGFSGADLDNCLYNETTHLCLGTGAISVSNLGGMTNDFNENQHFGLWAVSKGTITVTNIRANNNGSDGALLWNDRGGSSAAVTVATSGAFQNEFVGNGQNLSYAPWYPSGGEYYWARFAGLTVMSGGNISIQNSNAKSNSNDNGWGAGIIALNNNSAAPKTVTITNIAAVEGDNGLIVFSKGNITLTKIYSANNVAGNNGITLDNCLFDDGLQLCLGSGTIRLTDVTANENQGTGIQAYSKGMITLLGVNAQSNWNVGIELHNNFSRATAGISLTNVASENNNQTGILAYTNGSASLNTINTNNNARTHGGMGSGETVQDFFNQSHGPDSWWFDAEYDVTYTFTLLADAGWDLNRAVFDPWIELYDSDDESSPIDISGTLDCTENVSCEFSFNPEDLGFSETHTFYVLVGSNNNDGFYRLSLNDLDPSDSTNYFWVSGTGVTAGGNISVNAIESHSNELIGLGATVMGNGAITLSNLHISDNGSEGIYLTCGQDPNDFNNSGFGTGTITLSGDNYTHSNGWDGLIMATSGNVTILKLDASSNGQPTGSPAIKIRDGSVPKVIALSNININNSGGVGLWAFATGNITLTNVNVSENSNTGIYLDNCQEDSGNCTGGGFITLNSVWTYNNAGLGIELYSKGVITLNTVEASNNSDGGITLSNKFDNSVAGVALAAVRADNNGHTGLQIFTNGSLVMANISANNNAKTWGGMSSGNTVQDFFNNNKGRDSWGFEAEEGTLYTLLLRADGYGIPGLLNRFSFDPFMKLHDQYGNEITSGLTITSTVDDYYQIEWTPGVGESGNYVLEVGSSNGNLFDGEEYDGNSGFYRLSINDSDPSDSTSYFFVNGLGYEVGGNVTMTGINQLSDNADAGLIGWSNGAVSLTNIIAQSNGAEGIYIDNTGGSGNVAITSYNDSSFNGWEGLRVETNGVVSIANLGASNNGQDGIRITANTIGRQVSLVNVTANENTLKGLNLVTHGATVLSNFRGWFNGEDGANVDTYGYNLLVLNSTFMCNDNYGLAYMGYLSPFTFIDIGNIYICNGNDDLKELS